MGVLADHVLNEVLQEQELPDELLKLLYISLDLEQRERYPAFLKRPHGISQKHVDIYAYVIMHILKGLPKYVTSDSNLKASIGDLRGLTPLEVIEGEHIPKDFRAWKHKDKKLLREYPGWRGGRNALLPGSKIFRDLLEFKVGIEFDQRDRFKHTHIQAGTGAGKTVLLEQLIG